MIITIYQADTGRIVSVDQFPDEQAEDALLNIPEGCLAIEGRADPVTHFIDITNDDAPTPYPEKPGPWAVFDYAAQEWVDPRTAEDHAAELQAWREGARLTKLAFIQRCLEFGIMTPDDAKQAVVRVPDAFAPIVASLPPMERDYAEINWGGATEVDRLDPFILGVAQGAGYTDDLLDQLFGREE